jgi:hypothetical protein
MVSKAHFTWYDYDGERGSSSVNMVDLNGTNFDAQAGLANDIRTAMNGVTLEFVSKADLADNLWNNLVFSNNPLAQREIKWAIIVNDGVSNYRGMEIPVADLSILENNSKYIVRNGVVTVTGAAVAVQALIDAIEAGALSKTGAALQVVDIYQVGRNT